MYGNLFMNVALIHEFQGNVLIDDSDNPCLADFGLATVAEEPELQWCTTTAEMSFNSRWRAPEEVIATEDGSPERPTFKSDIYSLGSVMFFVRFLCLRSPILTFLPPGHLWGYTMEREEAWASNLPRTFGQSHPCAPSQHLRLPLGHDSKLLDLGTVASP
jgi:serine/threonine protein kinase